MSEKNNFTIINVPESFNPKGSSTYICPKCSSSNVVHIIYGYRNYLDEDQKKELAGGKSVFGGCGVNPDAPEYLCNDCNAFIGRGPMWRKEMKIIYYALIIVLVVFYSCNSNKSEVNNKRSKEGNVYSIITELEKK